MTVALDDHKDVDYMAADNFGRFIWMEHLLRREGAGANHNYQHLECYHQNSFAALLQAWHVAGLVEAARDASSPPPRLTDLAAAAKRQLRDPRFVNASSREFLKSKDVQDLVAEGKNAK